MRFRQSNILYALLAALLVATLAGCGPVPPQELVFTLLASGQSSQWASDDPGLLVIAQADDIAAVTPHLSPEVADALQSLDYGREFALLILRGRDARIPAQDPIRRIVWWGNVVTVQMQLGEASAEPPSGSPYTLVRVEKGPNWGGAHTLRLVTPGTSENIITLQQAIP